MLTIRWHVEENAWDEAAAKARMFAAGSDTDRYLRALMEAWLLGTIKFLDGAQPFRPMPIQSSRFSARARDAFDRGFEQSVVAFAVTLASAFGPLDEFGARRGNSIVHHDIDDSFWILFTTHGSTTEVTSSDTPGWKIEFPTIELRSAAEQFLRSFADVVAERIPAFIEWETFRPIMAWRSPPNAPGAKSTPDEY